MEGAPKTTIGRFLTQLAEDEALLMKYQINPRDAMTDAGVSPTDQELILSNNLKAIRQAIKKDFKTATIALIVHP